MPTKKTSAAAAAPAPAAKPRAVTRIVSHAPEPPKPPERNLAGKYRVIHGRYSVPRDRSLTHNPDGTRKENEELQEYAKPGAILEMTHEDAKAALLAGVVEELDASPSRVGRVFEAGEPHDNSKQARSRVTQHLSPLVRGMQRQPDA
jgi:hypothetical protein